MNIATDEWILAIEAHTGEPVAPRLVPFVQDMVTAAEVFTDLGRKDAMAALPPYSDKAFHEWAKSKFPHTPEIAAQIAGFVQESYIDGYKEYAT